MPEDEVASLLDAASSALTWMAAGGDADDDGLLEYIDESGTGLSNQGWRDSTDSIRWQDGRLAEAPIALAEVQAYAYRAALDGASLLDAFGRPDGEKWRSWAARLKERFDATYWLLGPLGRYPAVALDRDKRPVDSVTSTLGHLLGSGILTPADEASVASYLGSPELDSGLGLRTLSTDSVGFNPLGYHTGSVWPHDSAIAARGLALAGRGDLSVSVIRGLLDAAPSFEYRLPELFGGFGRDAAPPVPYPAACRPQAWSAAAAVSMLQTLLGLDVDVPNGTMKVRPLLGGLTPLWVRGLRIGDHPLEVRTDANHEVVLVTDAPVSSTPR